MDWQDFVDTGVSTWLESLRIKGQAAEINAQSGAAQAAASIQAQQSAAERAYQQQESKANRETLKFMVGAIAVSVVAYLVVTRKG